MFVYDIDVVPFVQCPCLCIVEFVVEEGTTPIFHGIFECCDDENYDQRHGAKTRVRCAKDGEYLELGDSMEKILVI